MKRTKLPNLEPRSTLLLLWAAAALPACDASVDPGEPAFRYEEEAPPGIWPPTGGTLNTGWLGNTPLMRVVLPGYPEAHRGVEDARIQEIEVLVQGEYGLVSSVDSAGGELVLWHGGTSYRGEELLGSRWWLDKNKSEYLTITQYGDKGGTFGYQFEYHYSLLLGSPPVVCQPDENGDEWAYIVGNVKVDPVDASIEPDTDALLVACTSGALGKAISWGFTPWVDELGDGLDLYRTGVRTVRADYCGTGESFTVDGTLIQVDNDIAGQSFTSPQEPDEAVFGPDGALCLSNTRLRDLPPCAVPDCQLTESGRPTLAYGSHAWTKLAP